MIKVRPANITQEERKTITEEFIKYINEKITTLECLLGSYGTSKGLYDSIMKADIMRNDVADDVIKFISAHIDKFDAMEAILLAKRPATAASLFGDVFVGTIINAAIVNGQPQISMEHKTMKVAIPFDQLDDFGLFSVDTDGKYGQGRLTLSFVDTAQFSDATPEPGIADPIDEEDTITEEDE